MGKIKFKLTKKQVLTGVGVVALLLLAVGAGFLLQMLNKQAATQQQGPEDSTPQVVNEIQELRLQGDTQAVDKKINEQLNSASTPDDTKYMLYIQQGNAATDTKNWKAAIESYLKAESMKQTYEVMGLLADTYRQAGDNTKAIEYYKKAIPLIPDTPVRDDDRESIETKIRNLGGQV